MNQPVIWQIQYLNGLIITEDTISPGENWTCSTKDRNDIKYVSLLTPNGNYTIDIQTGLINNQSLYRDGVEITNQNVTYKPFQFKEGFFISETNKSGVLTYNIGWEADFGEYKVKAKLSIDGVNFKPSIFVEEVV